MDVGINFKGQNSDLREKKERYLLGHIEGLDILEKWEASCSRRELNRNSSVVQPVYRLKYPGFQTNFLWVNRPRKVLVLLRCQRFSVRKCEVFTNFFKEMNCLETHRKGFLLDKLILSRLFFWNCHKVLFLSCKWFVAWSLSKRNFLCGCLSIFVICTAKIPPFFKDDRRETIRMLHWMFFGQINPYRTNVENRVSS